MKTSFLSALPLLLAAALPALAQDRFELEGESRGQAISATLVLEGGYATISVEGKAGFKLAGALEARGSSLVGTLRSNRGMSGALTPGFRTDRWNLRLRREGPIVKVRLASRYRSLKLEGLSVLGERNLANEALIRRFYRAFVRSDGETMASVYASEIHFTDPVFPNLRGSSAGDMWKMLCESAPKVTFSGIRADGRFGVAHWEADYELFGNKIHNVIEARFEFRDGLIVRHVDQFSFKAWSRQAFGRLIRVLPSAAVRHVVRRISASQLKTFQNKRAQAGN